MAGICLGCRRHHTLGVSDERGMKVGGSEFHSVIIVTSRVESYHEDADGVPPCSIS